MHGTSTRTGGSHAFSRHPAQTDELERLRRQAAAVWPVEARWLEGRGLEGGMRVLDVGCGPGFVTERLAALNPGGETVGLEPDPVLARTARARFQAVPGLALHEGSLAENALPAGGFDFAYVRFVLQHLAEPGAAMLELRRLLRPGGRAVLADADDGLSFVCPEPPELRELVRMSQEAQAKAGGNRFVGRTLPALLTEAGFSEVGFELLPFTSHALGRRALFDMGHAFRLRRVEHLAGGAGAQLADAVSRFFEREDWHGAICVVAAFGVNP